MFAACRDVPASLALGPAPVFSREILQLDLRAGAQLGLELRPSETSAWSFSTQGAVPKPALGECEKLLWGLVKCRLLTGPKPGLLKPRSRPRL